MTHLKIGVTKCESEKAMLSYIAWLTSAKPFGYDVEPVVLDYAPDARLQNLEALKTLDAIVFTGGYDVEPERYGLHLSAAEKENLHVESIPQRDEMEWLLAAKSFEQDLPVLGICRGMQFLNIFLGGTLITDIQSASPNFLDHRKAQNSPTNASSFHPVYAVSGSHLLDITEAATAIVTSRHHQAVDKLGRGLRVSATSPDGIVEAAEGENILLVQWHPERMLAEGRDNAYSQNLLKGFLAEVSLHRTAKPVR
jgi:putative glutamine amidotransferase